MPRAISHPPISGNSGLRPSLALDFTIAPTVDSRITFTRASNATYFDSTGTLQTASVNVPRIDYDPVTLAARGLLIEESRTNAIRNPRAEGAVVGTPGTFPTNWGNFSTSGLSSSIIGFGTSNGLPYVDVRYFGTTNNTFIVMSFDTTGVVASAGQVWTNSVYVAIVGGTTANIVNFNVENRFTGASIVDTAFTPTAVLTRFTSIGTAGAGATNNISALDMTVNNAAAVDITLRLAAPQLELGSFATSLILPAIGTPLATIRALETATMPSSSFYNAAAATLQIEASATGTPVGTTRWAALDDGTLSNRIEIRRNLGLIDAQTQISSANVASVGAANELAFALGSIFKYAIAASGTTAASCGNGGTVSTFSAVVMPVGVTTLQIGSGNTGPVDGYIRKIRYWPRALANSDLQKVTT